MIAGNLKEDRGARSAVLGAGILKLTTAGT